MRCYCLGMRGDYLSEPELCWLAEFTLKVLDFVVVGGRREGGFRCGVVGGFIGGWEWPPDFEMVLDLSSRRRMGLSIYFTSIAVVFEEVCWYFTAYWIPWTQRWAIYWCLAACSILFG